MTYRDPAKIKRKKIKEQPRRPLVSVTIPKKVLSGNVTMKRHWSVYGRYKRSWDEFLGWLMPALNEPPGRKMKVEITSNRGRFLDTGNLIQGCKPILDYLVRANYLENDSPHWIEDSYHQKISHANNTIIKIREC